MKILVADDSELSRFMLKQSLQKVGNQVILARNGQEALDKASREHVDLIISDVMMPQMDGFQLCHALKKDPQLKHIPFVFYSADYIDDKDQEFALQLGAARYLVKTSDVEGFVAQLEDLLTDRQMLDIGAEQSTLAQAPEEYLRGYSERVVQKLEEMVLKLEQNVAETRATNEELKTLLEVAYLINANLNLGDLLFSIGEIVMHSLTVTSCAFMMLDQTGEGLTIVSEVGNLVDQIPDLWFPMSDDTVLTRAVREQQPVSIHHVGQEASCRSLFPAELGITSVAAVPLSHKDTVVGVLLVTESRGPRNFTDKEIHRAQAIANQAATAIINADLLRNLEEKVVERTRALQATQKQLVQSESLAAIGQLVAGVAHELNNPLASAYSLVQSSADALKKVHADTGHADLPETIDDLEFVLTEQNRAKDIVAALLGLSRQTNSYQEPVNLNKVVRDAWRVLHNQDKHRVPNLQLRLAEGLPELRGNFAQLGQVVLNITQNAVQAVPEGKGEIEIATRFLPEQEQVQFICKDNGLGIPEENLANIYKPFFTTKPVGQGTGLGLYICHEIVTRHGGKLEVTTAPGQGTTFTICLPVAGPQGSEERKADA